jgi:ABC-type amino acid transport substrate-binding protein
VAAEIIRVGIYDFPPYVFIAEKSSGITIEMIAEINKFQNKYELVAVPTTARRRYRDFEQNKFDIMLFESKNWGWDNYPVIVSTVFVKGKEVYVAQAKNKRGQDFFSDFKNKAMIGVLGYHYQFANFKTEQSYIDNNFNLLLTDSQKKSLALILNNRGEIAVLSNAYLNYHFSHFPEDKAKLLISDKYDQIYQHTILVNKNEKISLTYINNLLDKMKQSGTLTPLWQKYGLEESH